MLIKKDVRITKKDGCINMTDYQCDMCKKIIKLSERYGIGVTDLGCGTYRKKWDLCAKCMRSLERNVNLWYARLEEKKNKC